LDDVAFGFEELDVCRRAVEFLAVATTMIEGLPVGQHSLADRLRRAALSVPVNVAEGVGRRSVAGRRRLFAIARGPAMEGAATVEVCGILGMADAGLLREVGKLLIRVVSMPSRMCRVEAPNRSRPRARANQDLHPSHSRSFVERWERKPKVGRGGH